MSGILEFPTARGRDQHASGGSRREEASSFEPPGAGRSARWMVVHLPAFRLERCGFSPDDLAAVVAEERSAIRVIAATPAARGEGIHPGTTAAEARALLPEIELLPLEREEEASDRRELLQAFGALSDRISGSLLPLTGVGRSRPDASRPSPTISPLLDEDDVLLEVSCTSHLFGGEKGVVEAASAIAERLGHRSYVALADDPIGAAAIARFCLAREGNPYRVIPVGALREHLADLPLAALGPSPELHTALRVVGLRWIREFAALDPASVAGRWGEEAARLLRVARGHPAGVLVSPPVGEEPVVISAPLAGATTLGQLQFALTGVLSGVVREVSARDQAIVRLRLVLRQEGGWADGGLGAAQLTETAGMLGKSAGSGPVVVAVRVGRPTRDLEILERLVRSRLEGVRLTSPLSELVVEVAEVAPAVGWQPGLVDRTEATEPLPDLLARMLDALGEQAVFSPALVDSWRPEGAWEPVAFTFESQLPVPGGQARSMSRDAANARSRAGSGPLAVDPVEAQEQWAPSLPRPRPAVLLPAPRRIEVEEVRGRPARLSLEKGEWPGLATPISRAEGPERLVGEWWQIDRPLERDYWVVEFAGRSAWIFHQRTTWWLHGWFD